MNNSSNSVGVHKKINQKKLIVNLAVALFASLFMVGLLMLYYLDIRPKQRLAASADWQRIDCTVIEAHSSFDSPNNYWAIYSYVVGGTTFYSEQLSFWPGNVNRTLTAGSHYNGLVNPYDVNDAVLLPREKPPTFLQWVIYGWVLLSGIGFIQYFLVRFNMKPIRMSYLSTKKFYYDEM